ncbi:hypothetical protein [Vibrio mediterranei]|uniref:hypothetical protein n=1 Tax=Vibrio mediterranei TaxID=689 RepID=UPI004068FE26
MKPEESKTRCDARLLRFSDRQKAFLADHLATEGELFCQKFSRGSLSIDELRGMTRDGKVLAIQGEGDALLYPEFQVNSTSEVHIELQKVLPKLLQHLDETVNS